MIRLIVVMHRPDNLLQKSAARKVSEDLKGTFIYEVTHPVHCALLSFLNAGVVGSHASEAELKEVLESWPDYAKARGIDIRGEARDFDKLWIDQDTIAAASGMGGNFEIALIVRS